MSDEPRAEPDRGWNDAPPARAHRLRTGTFCCITSAAAGVLAGSFVASHLFRLADRHWAIPFAVCLVIGEAATGASLVGMFALLCRRALGRGFMLVFWTAGSFHIGALVLATSSVDISPYRQGIVVGWIAAGVVVGATLTALTDHFGRRASQGLVAGMVIGLFIIAFVIAEMLGPQPRYARYVSAYAVRELEPLLGSLLRFVTSWLVPCALGATIGAIVEEESRRPSLRAILTGVATCAVLIAAMFGIGRVYYSHPVMQGLTALGSIRLGTAPFRIETFALGADQPAVGPFAVSQDGSTLVASAYATGRVEIWDAKTLARRASLDLYAGESPDHAHFMHDVALSPNGRLLAIACHSIQY